MSDARSDSLYLLPPVGTARRMKKVATATTAAKHALFSFANTVTSSTDATPIVATIPTGHGFVVGDSITISGHTTNVAANGTWVVSAVSATTVTLTGSVGSGAGAGAGGTIDFSDPNYALPKTKVWIDLECETNDCWVRLCDSTTTAGTTQDNGHHVRQVDAAGARKQRFFINPAVETHLDILSQTGAGILKWWVSSPPCERIRQ